MTDGSARVSLLICDDHKVLTDALSMVVGVDETLSLVAPPVHTPEEGVMLSAEQLPDVVLMDIMFKGSEMTGIEANLTIVATSFYLSLDRAPAATKDPEQCEDLSLTARWSVLEHGQPSLFHFSLLCSLPSEPGVERPMNVVL